jgi:hypothetical protein
MTVVTQLLAPDQYRFRISPAPTITCLASVTIDCPATPQWPMPTASDLCDQSVTVAQVGDETSSGTCPVVYTRNYIATDDCGNTATCSRSVSVQDITAPTITCLASVNHRLSCYSTVANAYRF